MKQLSATTSQISYYRRIKYLFLLATTEEFVEYAPQHIDQIPKATFTEELLAWNPEQATRCST
jgi:hypothetical protein